MTEAWPALCTFFFLGLLLVLIIRFQLHAFLALLLVSLGLGLAAGLPPPRIIQVMSAGVGDILRSVAIILALGAILGRFLEASGGAEVLAHTIIKVFGEKRTSLALLVTSFLIGIPILFNVGFLLLLPIVWRLQKDSGKSLLFFLLPVTFAMGMAHSLVPPKPGIVGAVNLLGGPDPGKTMVQTIIFGSLLAFPISLFGWYVPGRWWARNQFVPAPTLDALPQAGADKNSKPATFAATLLIVTLPLILSLVGFGSTLFIAETKNPDKAIQAAATVGLAQQPLSATPALAPRTGVVAPWQKIATHSLLDWLLFLGTPTMAMFVPTMLALYFLGFRCGLGRVQLEKLGNKALKDVGEIVFLSAPPAPSRK